VHILGRYPSGKDAVCKTAGQLTALVQIQPDPHLNSRKEALTMVMITSTTYFSNNILIHHQVRLSQVLMLMDHPHVIVPPDADLIEVHSPSQVILVPDRLIFNINRAFVPHLPQPTKRLIYARDEGRCAYCGKGISLADATVDHILPLSQGGRSTWLNLVNCCTSCNQHKGNRTPQQAHMQLQFQPFMPKVRPLQGDLRG
jgi:HNH endonuclease